MKLPVAHLQSAKNFTSVFIGLKLWRRRESLNRALSANFMTRTMRKVEPVRAPPRVLLAVLATMSVVNCGGDGNSGQTSSNSSYTVGGSVSGLTGSGLALQVNASDALSISKDGVFTFSQMVATGSAFVVTVLAQPSAAVGSAAQICTVSSGSGTISGNVTSVSVTCVNNAARFLFMANNGSNDISAFSIDNDTGALTPVSGSPFAAGGGPTAVVLHPSGKFAYVTNGQSNSVSAFSVDGSTGAFTPISGSPYIVYPYTIPSGGTAQPITMVIDPSGSLAIVANPNSTYVGYGSTATQPSNVSAYSINTVDGTLAAVSGSPFSSGAYNPILVAVDPGNKFFYLVNTVYQIGNDQAALSVFAINPSTSGITALTGSPFPLERGAVSFEITPNGDSAYYLDNSTNRIFWFTPDSITGSFEHPAGYAYGGAFVPAILPSGQFLYDSLQSQVYGFSVNSANGALTQVTGAPYSSGKDSARVTTDPSGRDIYIPSPGPALANSGLPDNAIYAFSIDATTGGLTPVIGSPFAGANSGDTLSNTLVIEPGGRFAYITSATQNLLYAFSINQSTAALTPVPGSPFGTGTNPGTAVFLE